MRTLVEHYTLCSSGHSRICYLGSRWQTTLDQGLKHLSSPDHRHMRCLADPEYLFLNLGHSFEADLDSKISSRQHHGCGWSSHCRKQNPRKGFNCGAIFDFQDDPGLRRPKAAEFLHQFCHVFGTPDKRERDQVSMFCRKFKVRTVFRGQGRNTEFGIWQINAFLGAKFGSALSSVGDFQMELRFPVFFPDGVNDPPDLAVIEENALPGLCVSEHCRERATDLRRLVA